MGLLLYVYLQQDFGGLRGCPSFATFRLDVAASWGVAGIREDDCEIWSVADVTGIWIGGLINEGTGAGKWIEHNSRCFFLCQIWSWCL